MVAAESELVAWRQELPFPKSFIILLEDHDASRKVLGTGSSYVNHLCLVMGSGVLVLCGLRGVVRLDNVLRFS